MFVKLAKQSLISRRTSVLLTVLAITISVFVLLSVEHIRHQAKQSFNRTVSGVDLIVGPRTSQINLLLSSVFRIGDSSNAISQSSVEDLASHPMVSWVVPIALGDSHKGHRVMATTADYFQYFKFGAKQPLTFKQGQVFKQHFDLVLGADIAEKYSYELGKEIVLSHGTGVTSFTHHEQTPFTVVGILNRTGTPVDQTLHVSFEGLHHMHEEPQNEERAHKEHNQEEHDYEDQDNHEGHAHHDKALDHEEHENHDEDHDHEEHAQEGGEAAVEHDHDHKVSAVFVGLKARFASLVMQKWANDYKGEALSAIMPGVALSQLWRMVGSVETVLQVISILVLITTLIGLSTMLLATMRERTKEIAILRVLGASPMFIFMLIELEVFVITFIGCIAGALLLWITLLAAEPLLASQLGLFIDTNPISETSLMVLAFVLVGSLIMGLIPAINAYRHSLQANLTAR
ncbi:ABC transporter permease [Psychrosphaera haliotis]|uniref:FtsX-like permease family protein n=1 Tax=Psychrosphaera haliotis TaxID=555083 RepID=A0A6N8F812_9GAMM|nr:ABC transporter permease [Psychrosphaera haliotis]MUH72543.1 FtsX-like permease family protein [Psychrosphaera haliotis]